MNDTPSAAPVAAPPGGDVGRDNSQDRKAGYREMPAERTAPKQPRSTEREFATGREAADELARKRRREGHVPDAAQEVGYWTNDKSYTAPKNETVTVERAAEDLKNKRTNEAFGKEIHDRNDIAFKIDQFRADNGAPTDPTWRDNTQIDPKHFGSPESHLQPQIDPQDLPRDLQPAPPGIDPDLHAAFQNPKIREAVEKEVLRANEREVAFGDGMKAAQNAAIASFAAHYPEFVGKSPAQIQAAFAQMQKQNPQRAQQAQAAFQNAVKFETALKQNEARVQHAEQQQFQTYAREQDRTFERMVGNQTPQQRQAIASEMISYAGEMGVDQKTLVHLMQTNPIMRHSAFQRMMHDATAHRLAQKSLAAMQRQNRAANIPPVMKPGTSNGGGVRAVQNANLQSLRDRLAKSGDIKDAVALRMATKKR